MYALWDHQVQGIRVAEVLPDLGLLFEQGTGKTRTMIEILRRRYAKAGRLQRTLILAPIIVCENWKDEFKKFSKISPRDVMVLTGKGKDRIRTFINGVGEDLKGAKIIVTNYESMQMKDFYKLIELWTPEVLVCDESQRIKNHESVRAKAVMHLADLSSQNFILTGTPILDGKGMDAFMQFRILDRGMTFGKNYFAFRKKFFEDENLGMPKQTHFPKWVPRPLAFEEFQKRIKAKALRVLKKDCLDLPPLVRQTVYAELSPAQLKAYREMHNEYITFVESKSGEPQAVVAQLAVVKALRLQQIVTGFLKVPETDEHVRFECPRLAVLKELLDDIAIEGGHKVIIWAVFKENYKMIAELCQELKLDYRMLTGETKDRDQQMRDFRTDPNVKVMIANQGAGGVGVNLIEAPYAIYYSKGFKLEDDLQSEARNYRGGSEMHEKVTRIDIVTKGTIDEAINEVLAMKQQAGAQILGWKDKIKI